MKFILSILAILFSINLKAQTIYQYKANDINGKEVDFSQFKGKKILIVNTASKCGLTPQYEELEKLYQLYKDKNFVLIGFPANNFAEQEPGDNKEIADFCLKNYGVSFLMMSKVSVKGNDQAEIYKFLTQKSLNGVEDSDVKWNFQKYAIDETGKLVRNFAPKIKPLNEEITKWIEGK